MNEIPAFAGMELRAGMEFFSSHSCEGRNLRRRKAAGNCTFVRLRRQFAPTARRFLPSQEWDGGGECEKLK
ncbi:MAG: hypothetical protein ACR2QC_10260 [Gammaproteobacteria bacterium]